MQLRGILSNQDVADPAAVPGGSEKHIAKIHVCIGTADGSRNAIALGKVLARAFAAELAFVHVIEMHDANGRAPFDPVEWDIKRREAEAKISRLAQDSSERDTSIAVEVLEGRCAEQICKALSGRPHDIAVLCRSQGGPGAPMGETVRRMVENGTSSLLIVPETPIGAKIPDFSRILLLLDGSTQSESAIPIALEIAESENAEIILLHATPEPELTQAGPPEPRDVELMEELRRRNTRIAQKYLNRQTARLQGRGVKTRTVLSSGGDVRRQLLAAVTAQAADLVVMATHGQSGFADTALGNVANFMINRSMTPVLMVRGGSETAADHVFSAVQSKGVRRPGALAQ